MSDKSLDRFFLACDCKPGSPLFSAIDPFAYDIKPAYIHGSLGIIHYDPNVYSIIELHKGGDPLLGYLVTITHKDTISLLDRLKGYHGPNGFNLHTKVLLEVFTESDPVAAWAYVLSEKALEQYETLEQIELGDLEDPKLLDFFESLGLSEEEDDEEIDDSEEDDEESTAP